MESVIRKWGNSPALRLSSSLMKEAKLSIDQKVSVKVHRNRIIIEPLAAPEYKIEDLVAGINESNLHSETDVGAPVGREIW